MPRLFGSLRSRNPRDEEFVGVEERMQGRGQLAFSAGSSSTLRWEGGEDVEEGKDADKGGFGEKG
jgi:hypothetical protein